MLQRGRHSRCLPICVSYRPLPVLFLRPAGHSSYSSRHSNTYQDSLKLLASGRLPNVAKLVTTRIPLANAKKAFETLVKGVDDEGKMVLKVVSRKRSIELRGSTLMPYWNHRWLETIDDNMKRRIGCDRFPSRDVPLLSHCRLTPLSRQRKCVRIACRVRCG